MADVRIGKMQFRGEHPRGDVYWTEQVALTTAADNATGLVDLAALAAKRVMFLGNGVHLYRLVVSKDGVFRDVRRSPGPNLWSEASLTHNEEFKADPADFSNSTFLLTLGSTLDIYNRPYWLSGNPDAAQSIRMVKPSLGQWTRRFNEWKTVLMNGKYGIRVQDRDNAALTKGIIGVAVVAGAYVFTTDGAHSLVRGNKVRISNIQATTKKTRPNGVFTIDTALSGTTFNVLNLAVNDDFVYLGGGSVRKIEYKTAPITSVATEYFSNRKHSPKNPRGQAGRRKTKS